jgi:predicted kinase
MTIPKIKILRGIPASGKSTYAKENTNENTVRINRDDLRAMLGYSFNNFDKNLEAVITVAVDNMIRDLLNRGYNLIIDNLNLKQSYVNNIHNIAEEIGNVIVEEIHFPIMLEEAKLRNISRGTTVPTHVIEDLYNRFKNIKINPSVFYGKVNKKVEYDNSLSDCIICDIDGTVALFDRDKKNPYCRDFENDEDNKPITDILYYMNKGRIEAYDDGYKIIFVSGRSDDHRKVTEEWIDLNITDEYQLHMRKQGDCRKDSIIKQEIYNEHIKGKFNVLFVLDDRNQTVNMWRRNGLTCLQVADGNF